MKITWDNALYEFPVPRDKSGTFELPTEPPIYLKATKWYPTRSPHPMTFEVGKAEDPIYEGTLIKKLDSFLVTPLIKRELRARCVDGYVRFKVKTTFDELLEFTFYGFRDWCERQLLAWNPEGHLRNVRFKLHDAGSIVGKVENGPGEELKNGELVVEVSGNVRDFLE